MRQLGDQISLQKESREPNIFLKIADFRTSEYLGTFSHKHLQQYNAQRLIFS